MPTKCTIKGAHCESCGRPVDPFHCEDGYTSCCNELISYSAADCRNHHADR